MSFYNETLSVEMKQTVDKVLFYYESDAGKEAAAEEGDLSVQPTVAPSIVFTFSFSVMLGGKFNFPLPWYPGQDQTGEFITKIPEVTMSVLVSQLRLFQPAFVSRRLRKLQLRLNCTNKALSSGKRKWIYITLS